MYEKQLVRIALTALFIPGFLQHHAWAEMNINAGVEQFNWKEYGISGGKLLEESGPRFFIGFEKTKDADAGFLVGFAGKAYFGRVEYDGQSQNIQTGQTTPFMTNTNYIGLQAEFKPHYRTKSRFFKDHYLDLASAIGLDQWNRELVDGTNQSGQSVFGYIENYLIFYLRAGLEINPRDSLKGLHAGAGLKYPFYTFERANLARIGYDSDPLLRPEPSYSFYGHAGIRLNRTWDISVYYDSFRFKKSPNVPTSRSGQPVIVWQPRSEQYAVGIKLSYFLAYREQNDGRKNLVSKLKH